MIPKTWEFRHEFEKVMEEFENLCVEDKRIFLLQAQKLFGTAYGHPIQVQFDYLTVEDVCTGDGPGLYLKIYNDSVLLFKCLCEPKKYLD